MQKKYSKKEAEKLTKKLMRDSGLVWDSLNKNEKTMLFSFSDDYKNFLDSAKTEREAVIEIIRLAEKKGFKNIDENGKVGGNIDKFYKYLNHKTIALGILGKKSVTYGLKIIGSHIDSPRLDLKQNPLYEDVDIALLKTHYYGGIHKYQWLARPLALHGTFIKKDNSKIDFIIGESDKDPVFTISDLLPHLAKDEISKKVSSAFSGEKLNLITGSIPIGDSKINERFKLSILDILYKKYGIVEEDFLCGEIEVVPAGKSRDVGIDRSLIGAYGQDDRVCAFTSLMAVLNTKKSDKTHVAFFFDKEEVGSEGNTGANSRFVENFVSDLLHKSGEDTSERTLRKTLYKSQALSADVNAGLEPDFQNVSEKKNTARLGYGVCITKFTGARGKAGANDASAEYLGYIRKIFNYNKITWHTGEIGKVDQGGGGTIAKFMASYGMDIVDCGPPVLSMHSPFEISSKADVYMTYLAYKAFLSE